MNSNEELILVKNLIQAKKYNEAEKILLDLLGKGKIKNIEDENETHYTFNGFIDFLTFCYIYDVKKKNVSPDLYYSYIYYNLGFIEFEKENFDKAIEYDEKGLEWNPVNVSLMFELAATYRKKGDIEKFKNKIDAIHNFIYDTGFLAKFYRELGWYYIENKRYDIANALYTCSLMYFKTDGAYSELAYIAQQEKREIYFSTEDEIKILFAKYNIPLGFNKGLIAFLIDAFEKEKENENMKYEVLELSNALYKITLDKKYIIYTNIRDKELKFEFKIPQNWKIVDKKDYEKLGFPEKIKYVISTADRNYMVINNIGKSDKKDFETFCKNQILKDKAEGAKMLYERLINDKQEYELICMFKENVIYDCYKFLDGNIIYISWPLYEKTSLDNLIKSVKTSLKSDVIDSIRGIENEKNELKEYLLKIEGHPTFKFYFPESMGEYIKIKSNIFILKKDGINKIRVMISKKITEEELPIKAKEWIEKNKVDNNMKEVGYKKEKINNIPIETYILEYIDKPKLAKKIYKIGLVNNYRITISGGLIKGKEEIINEAFRNIKLE